MTEQNGYRKDFTGCLVSPDGIERHFINGAYGREGDMPSVVHPDGTRHWFKENPKRGGFGQQASVPHRDGDQPATIRANGDQLFFSDGKLHRDGDQPAVILTEGTRKWFLNGVCMAYQISGGEKVCARL